MLNHSSGLGGPWGADDMIISKRPWCPSNITNLTQIKIAGKPGSNYLYSNVSYCLLGALINELSIEENYKKHIEKNYLSKELYFLDNSITSNEAPYNTKHDALFNLNYVNQLNFDSLASSAGLAGSPYSFITLIKNLYSKSDLDFLFKKLESQCATNLNNCYLWNFRLMKKDLNHKIIFSQGYLPGASSVVAINEKGDVLLWLAAGPPIEEKFTDILLMEVYDAMKNF